MVITWLLVLRTWSSRSLSVRLADDRYFFGCNCSGKEPASPASILQIPCRPWPVFMAWSRGLHGLAFSANIDFGETASTGSAFSFEGRQQVRRWLELKPYRLAFGIPQAITFGFWYSPSLVIGHVKVASWWICPCSTQFCRGKTTSLVSTPRRPNYWLLIASPVTLVAAITCPGYCHFCLLLQWPDT